ncbi:chloride channel protein CLC-f-like isoform X1 [Camellia sinensis]|uniref:chloride channel protein CLC-f-like isoform X1 n=1 Tax=Camellia sinensis TaxID=4442 RepID=UPI0010368593|nr:chloride channel protein CLC-f-like isoform X1 [Camellia sinensis]
MSGGEFRDHDILLGSNSSASESDLESQGSHKSNRRIEDLLKRLDRGFSGRRLSINRSDWEDHGGDAVLGDGAPPEWALLLVGCLLGLATGLCVAAFNRGVHVIHEWAWAGTPNEGAAWLRLQRLADTWHRILLVPVTGGVIVGMMHGLLEILDQIKQSNSSQEQGFDLLAGVFPTVKAIQAAVTLGTGCSLGPEGPDVDIGKSCANGCSLMMENNRERKIALVAAGAAAGIASGFNAAVAGCFFAIETVLRPLRAENSPPFTTAMIILASVISSTVSNAVLGEKQAFTVPTYDLKSAAELPLYLVLGMLCGVVSVVFTRLVNWFTEAFEFIKEKFGVPAVVCPALGGLGAGIIALKYPGILYWGFTNVDEILHTGKSVSAPGIWLLAQLAAAKVVATALCKGSGLVGGLYAPSLMIGAAVGAVFGGSAVELINSAMPGNASVAQPQAYALVGMAATLASVCSVPLTSVLLLFELTKDYRILLPLMGAVGLAIWVPSVTNQSKETEASDKRSLNRGYSALSPTEDKNEVTWRQAEGGNNLELRVIGNGENQEAVDEDIILEDLKVSQAMSKKYVKVSRSLTLKEALQSMHDNEQHCVLVVDAEDFLEGILTYGDIKRFLSKKSGDALDGDSSLHDVNTCLVSSICTRGISYRGRERGLLTCYPDTDLAIAKKLIEAKGIKQLPVVKHGGEFQRQRKHRIVAILYYDSIWNCLRLKELHILHTRFGRSRLFYLLQTDPYGEEINHLQSVYQQRKDDNLQAIISNGH